MYNTLITGNVVARELLRQPDEESYLLELSHMTVADNAIGAAHVISASSLQITNSFVWQPGKTTITDGMDLLNVEYLLTNDTSHLPAGQAAVAAPRFVDPERGDYRLKAGSRGVDYAAVNATAPLSNRETLDGHAHNLDVPIAGINAPNRLADVGAYERPALLPLVLNPEFDADLNLWAPTGPSSWDGAQNIAGPVGSGSVQSAIGIDDHIVRARTQCVHLPGPGTYYLNGWGRVTEGAPFDNTVRLEWELRHNGGALGCTNGTPNLAGVHTLAQGPAWNKPPLASAITLSAADWTPHSSLAIHLVVINGNPLKRTGANASKGSAPTAWFDGITLGIDGDGGENVFADGFE